MQAIMLLGIVSVFWTSVWAGLLVPPSMRPFVPPSGGTVVLTIDGVNRMVKPAQNTPEVGGIISGIVSKLETALSSVIGYIAFFAAALNIIYQLVKMAGGENRDWGDFFIKHVVGSLIVAAALSQTFTILKWVLSFSSTT